MTEQQHPALAHRHRRLARALGVAGLTLLAGAGLSLRLWSPIHQAFWLDEVCTHDFAAGTVRDVLAAYAADVHPPLYGILVYAWQHVTGGSETALRSFSALWSTLGILLVALLTRDISGSALSGVAAGLLTAINPLDIWYGQEARMYAQAALLATVAAWALWRWFEATEPLRARWYVGAYAASILALIYTHYDGAIVIAAQLAAGAALFASRRRWREVVGLLAVVAVVALCFLPWAIFVHRFRSTLYSAEHVGWIPRPRLADLVAYLNHEFFLGFGGPPPFLAGAMPILAAALLAIVVAAAASVSPRPTASAAPPARQGIAYLGWLAVGPAALAGLISVLWHPVYFPPRFALLCLAPTLAVVVAMLADVRPPLRTLLFAGIASLMVVGTIWQAATARKEGLPGLARLAATFGDPAYVFLSPSPHGRLVHFYLPRSTPQPTTDMVAAVLRQRRTALIWVGLKDGRMPAKGSPDQRFVTWLARTGPYRRLGEGDGFTVYEVHARHLPPT